MIIYKFGGSSIKDALGILERYGRKVTLPHCVSAYPTENKSANLKAIKTLRYNFGYYGTTRREIGLSDHTSDIRTSLTAVAMGCRVIEKHFKIQNDCPDTQVSLNPEQMKNLVRESKLILESLGEGKLGMLESEESVKEYRNVL